MTGGTCAGGFFGSGLGGPMVGEGIPTKTNFALFVSSVNGLTMSRRFPPPWTVEQTPGGYKVIDADGQALAYVYGARHTRWR